MIKFINVTTVDFLTTDTVPITIKFIIKTVCKVANLFSFS